MTFEEDEYAILNSSNIVINTIKLDNSLPNEDIAIILSSIGEDLSMVRLSEVQEGTVQIGSEYLNTSFKPVNPEPGTENFVYVDATNSWIPAVSYPENEPEGKYVYVSGEWVADLSFKIV